ncbi:hypothetical protein C1N81_08255 [Streptomyces sp. SGAir0957]
MAELSTDQPLGGVCVKPTVPAPIPVSSTGPVSFAPEEGAVQADDEDLRGLRGGGRGRGKGQGERRGGGADEE